MPVTVSFTFDDTWVPRLVPIVEQRVESIRDHPVIVSLLAGLGIPSVDDLTAKQKFKLFVMYDLLRDLAAVEGMAAGLAAKQSVIEDVEDTFPLEVD
jgi:hypothetical protein